MGFAGTAFQPYSNLWRKHRSLYHQQMNQVAVRNFQPSQMAISAEFLKLLLETPQDYVQHIRRYGFWYQVWFYPVFHSFPDHRSAANLSLSIAYGRELVHRFGQYLYLSEQVSKHFIRAVRPGEFLVESFPIRKLNHILFRQLRISLKRRPDPVKYIPSWFPGAGFQKWAKMAHDQMADAWDIPFQDVKAQMVHEVFYPNQVLTWYTPPIGERKCSTVFRCKLSGRTGHVWWVQLWSESR